MLESQQQWIEVFFASQLFHDVQMSGIFKDSKTFADAEPKSSFEQILTLYEQKVTANNFDLSAFVEQNFTIRRSEELVSSERFDEVQDQINHLWTVLKKPADKPQNGSLIPLDRPYTVPGGRFQEVYYWDSYFAALGLIQSGRISEVEDLIENFISVQQRVGCIPNGNRWYYKSRTQPPVLALLISLFRAHNPCSAQQLARYRLAVETEYRFWMRGVEGLQLNQANSRVVRLKDGEILNRYYDDQATPRPESYAEDIELAADLPESEKANFYRNIRAACESGWDFSSRWFRDHHSMNSIATTEVIPVDLNSILCFVETWLAEAYQSCSQEKANYYQLAASARKTAINKYLWNERAGIYSDYWFLQDKQSEVRSLAATWALFFNLCSESKAASMASLLQESFLNIGGLVTTLNSTEQQWDSPNGWAPLHWITIQGLKAYNFETLASQISECWLQTVTTTYQATGKLMEKYNVVDIESKADGGEYDVQEGFGWTNGVTLALSK